MSRESSRPLDEEAAQTLVKRVLAAVKVEDVRIDVTARDHGFTRYAANEVTTSGVVRDVTAEVTCSAGGRHASAVVHSADPARIAEAGWRASTMLEQMPVDPEWVVDPGAAAFAPIPAAFSDDAAAASPQLRGKLVAGALAVAKKRSLQLAGFFEHTTSSHLVATRRGFFGLHHRTEASLSTTARTPDGSGSGWAAAEGTRAADVDIMAATEIACSKASQARGGRPLPAGHYPVVLEAAAVAEMLGFLGDALDARDAEEGHSPMSRGGGKTRVGEKMFGALNLRVDPRAAQLPSAPFDREGMVRAPATYIEDGVVKRLSMSRYWGKKTGRPADANPGAILASGGAVTANADLLAGLDKGLLVTRFWYANVIDPATLSITGLTRDGVFWVEKGKIIHPVNNFRFNQSIPELFAAVEAYGPAQRFGGDWGGVLAPSLRAAKFHMASVSDAV